MDAPFYYFFYMILAVVFLYKGYKLLFAQPVYEVEPLIAAKVKNKYKFT